MSVHTTAGLSLAAIQALFENEAEVLKLERLRVVEDGQILVARAVTQARAKVAVRDIVRGGVALHAEAGRVEVHPYFLRLACTNGSVRTEFAGSEVVNGTDFLPKEEVEHRLRTVIRSCCAPERLAAWRSHMRDAREQSGIRAAHEVAHRLSDAPEVLERVEREFWSGPRSLFSLIQAITAVARDTKDLKQQWNLECLGGSLATFRPPPRIDPALLQRAQRPAGVLV